MTKLLCISVRYAKILDHLVDSFLEINQNNKPPFRYFGIFAIFDIAYKYNSNKSTHYFCILTYLTEVYNHLIIFFKHPEIPGKVTRFQVPLKISYINSGDLILTVGDVHYQYRAEFKGHNIYKWIYISMERIIYYESLQFTSMYIMCSFIYYTSLNEGKNSSIKLG